MEKSHQWLLGIIVVIIGLVAVYYFFNGDSTDRELSDRIANFEECAAAGNPVMESYPRQCRDAEGNLFVEEIDDEAPNNLTEKSDLIRVTRPQPGGVIESPLVIEGEARGPWYFEATFPVVLTDWDGRIIAEGYAEAHPPAGGDWMTENFVPFRATLEFAVPESVTGTRNRGSLILQKANPSGLPEHDDAVEMVIFFE